MPFQKPVHIHNLSNIFCILDFMTDPSSLHEPLQLTGPFSPSSPSPPSYEEGFQILHVFHTYPIISIILTLTMTLAS